MANAYEECQGRILRVDLSTGEVKAERVDREVVRQCLGGACLGAKLLYDEVPPGVSWDHPENRFIIASGPLGGTPLPGTGTFSVISQGALTNGGAVTQANGFFGAYLRHSGFDAVLVQGKAPKLSYIYIHDGTAEVRDASSLAGKDTWETVDMLTQELAGERPVSVVSIGPAGENKVRFAGVFGDKGHSASHNGVGAVMGAKNLKALVAVQGKMGVPVKDGRRLLALAEKMHADIKAGAAAGLDIFLWGTLNGVVRGAEAGATLPVKNYTTNIWQIDKERLEKFSGPYIRGHFSPARANCFGCLMHHVHVLRVPSGPHQGRLVDEPEYEGLAAWGPAIDQKDAAWAIILADLADRLGVDTNEGGWVVGLAMECYEKGLLGKEDTGGLELTWGNAEAAWALLHKIARREGLGDVLAEGAMRAAQRIGRDAPKFAIHTMKGNAPRGHDHRGWWSELFDTATSSTGTLETGGRIVTATVAKALNLPRYDRFSPDGTAILNAQTKGAMLFEDSLGICRFTTRTDVALLSDLLEATTGWRVSLEEALTMGVRAATRLRAFNLRHGVSSDLDRPSPRYGSAPVDGPVAGKSIMPHWEDMLRIYYEKMGWDEQGRPLPQTLSRLGLPEIIPHLWPPGR